MENNLEVREVFLLMTIGIAVMMLLALAFVLFFYFSQKKFQTQQIKAQEERLRHQEQLLFSTIDAQEKERQRIAKDLHDEIGSKLNVINLGLYRINKLGKENLSLLETTEEIFSVINDTIETTRRISHDLLPPTLEKFGLKEALMELCESFKHMDALNISFSIKQYDFRETEKNIELNIFRVVQELINNSLKHGKPSNIGIDFWMNKNVIKLNYQDDGEGFDQNVESFKTGLGMQNIESRLRMIKGNYVLESSPGKGVKAEIIYQYE